MAHITVPDEDNYQFFSNQTGTGAFSFTFTYFAKADLRVYKVATGGDFNDATELAQGDFTDTPVTTETGGYDGGSITVTTALASEDLWIVRDIDPSRTTDLTNAGYDADDLNDEFDQMRALQQDRTQRSGRRHRALNSGRSWRNHVSVGERHHARQQIFLLGRVWKPDVGDRDFLVASHHHVIHGDRVGGFDRNGGARPLIDPRKEPFDQRGFPCIAADGRFVYVHGQPQQR